MAGKDEPPFVTIYPLQKSFSCALAGKAREADCIIVPMKKRIDHLLSKLKANQARGGGWSYAPAGEAYAEPTALGALAFSAWQATIGPIGPALVALRRMQNADSGAVGISQSQHQPRWPTSLAMLAWHYAAIPGRPFTGPIAQAASWLLAERGFTFRRDPAFGHDTTIVGWPWVAGTHSWVEPTALAILGCKALKLGNHERVREAVRLILDRAVRTGGWNYGNNRVFDNELRAFPACTGLALLAIASEGSSPQGSQALEFLAREVKRIRSPMSLSWSLMGMTAWGRRPADADQMIVEAIGRGKRRAFQATDIALLLLAAAGDRCPLVIAAKTTAEGKP
jgi:hypothetical protein